MTAVLAAISAAVTTALLLSQAPPPADLHVVFDAQFSYMSRVSTRTNDVWLGQAKMATKLGDRLTIRREDKGVRWRVDMKAGTYTEEKIVADGVQGAVTSAKPDIHTAGYDFEVEYDWQVRESGRTSTIAGRPCRQFVATGDADYGESEVTFWVCTPIAGMTYGVNDLVLNSARSDSARKMIVDTLAKHGNAWVLGFEEKQEPPIAPTLVMTVTVKTLEAGPAPAGTFDLPENVKKAGR